MDGQGNVKEVVKMIKGEVNSDLRCSDFVRTVLCICQF